MADTNREEGTLRQSPSEVFRLKEKVAALEREEKILRSLILYSSLGIVSVDREMRISFCNPVFEQMFQYKNADLNGKNLDHVISRGPSRQEAMDFSDRTLSGVPVKGKGRRFRKDGSPIDVEFYAVPAIVDGEVVGAYGLYEDITEKIRIKKELTKSEKRLKQVLQSTPLGMGLVSDRIMLWYNVAMSRLLGYTKEELIGKNARMLYPSDEEFRKAGRCLKHLSRANSTTEVDTKWVRKNGELFDCHLWYSFLDEENGTPTFLVIAEDVTEKRKAEMKLREGERRFQRLYRESKRQEALYRSLLTSSADAIIIYNLQGEAEFVNPSFTEIFGWTYEEIRGKQIPFVPESEQEPSLRLIRDLLENGTQVQGFETRRYTKDGRFLDINISASRYNDHKGNPAGMLVVLRDITEKKRAKQKLVEEEKRYRELYAESKRQEEMYRSLLRSSADAIVIYNLQGEAEFVNPSFTKIFGWTYEEIRGKRIPFVPESEKAATHSLIERVLREGGPVQNFETRRLTKDGRILNISVSGSLFSDAEGKRAGLLVLLRDITEQVKAREEIRQSEKRFRELFNSVSDLIYRQDLEGRFLSFNRAVVKLMGYEPEEIIGKKASELMKPELSHLYDSEYLESIRRTGQHQGISVYLTKEGKKVYLEHKSILVQHEGEPPFISGIARDVTERVLSNRRVKKLREEMLQAQKMEAIGTLTGGIAHDFNNILMGIQGNLSLIKNNTPKDTPDYERLTDMEEHVRVGSELTSQLLGFARKGQYQVKPTDLNILITRESKLFGRAKKEVELHLKLQEGLWGVEVDQRQISQVLLNLFVNAWQAMPNGGQLYIETQNIVINSADLPSHPLSPGGYVQVAVTDTGTGMDEETKKRIFEPFFTTKEKGRGTGLGLASVYGIIKNHGGTIEVESAPHEGSTFTFYLPKTDKTVQAEPTTREVLIKGKGRVLLIDDEEKILHVGEQILQVLGYEVVTSSRGDKAVEIFKQEKGNFNLVILDMIMPGMGGKEVFQALRTFKPDCRVLLASGYSIDGEASTIMAQGCNGFIQKPFSMEKLSSKIQEILMKE